MVSWTTTLKIAMIAVATTVALYWIFIGALG